MIAGAPFYSIFALQNDRMSAQQYKSMQELAEELNQYLAAIGEGTGDVDRLQEMVGNARELYERLVVTRHKAFEDVVNEPEDEVEEEAIAEPEVEESVEQPAEDIQEAIPFSIGMSAVKTPISLDLDNYEPEEKKESEKVESVEAEQLEIESSPEPEEEPKEEMQVSIGMSAVMEPQSLDLDNYEPEEKKESAQPEKALHSEPEVESPIVPENQTSLIDAIEEISEESFVEKYASEDDSESLVEKLEKAPIADLVSAITLNQKFQFIRELFDGDNERYLAEIESFDSMDSWNSAKNVLGALDKEFGWEDGEVLEEFAELIQRRHSS
jgi:hypothetical protein